MKKIFFSNLVLLIILNVLIKPFFILGIDAAVQNRVGAENYGDYFALLNFSFLFNILLDFGITNYNTRNIAQSPNILKKHIGPIIGLKSVLFLTYIFFTIGSGLIIGYSDDQMGLLKIFMLNQFFVAMLLYFRSNFSGLHLFKTDAVFSVLDRLLLIILCSGLLWGNWIPGTFKIEWFVWAQTISYGIAAISAFILTLIHHGIPKIRINRQFSFVILRQSLPYALLILLMMFYNRIDSVMLERMLDDGKTESGIYAQGFRLLDAVNMFALLFAGLLFPIFARQIKLKQSFGELLSSASLVLMTCATAIGICCSFYAYDIMNFRYHEHIQASSWTFSILIISFIPISLTYIYGTLLTANGSLKQLNQMAFVGLIVNVVLNYFLIPYFGAFGAAVATLFTQTLTALIQLYLAFKIIPIRPNYSALKKYIVFVLILLFFIFFVKKYIVGIQGFIISGTISILIAIATGALPFREAIKLFSKAK
ncbi:MAG: oligosaccharide flippase family protein [Crocinitomicaceae bacterium]